jgi:two-component system sensor histidine kinase/response regulator
MKNAPSILIIDDNPNNFDVVAGLLSDRGYDLHYACSGKKALLSLELYNPDLILLDVMMPEMDGIELCRRIKAIAKWQTVPIIMVTALNSKADLANCLNAGADDFISKPLYSLELRARVQSMLRVRQQYNKIQSLTEIQAAAIKTLESSLQELRGNLASSLSHELNTPLNGIITPVELIKEAIKDLELDEISEMLDWVMQSAYRIEGLTKRFLMYVDVESEIHSGKSIFVSSQFSGVISEAKILSRAEAVGRRQDLKFDLEDAAIAIPERYLTTILHELIDNALKFSQQGSTILVSSRLTDDDLELSIHDQGRGMTPEQIGKISAFNQFDRHKYEQQGIGLGLILVKKIVELVSGKFSIRSIYQRETTVTLLLPLVKYIGLQYDSQFEEEDIYIG